MSTSMSVPIGPLATAPVPTVTGLPGQPVESATSPAATFVAMVQQALGLVGGAAAAPAPGSPPGSPLQSPAEPTAGSVIELPSPSAPEHGTQPEEADPVEPAAVVDVAPALATALAAALATGLVAVQPETAPVAPQPAPVFRETVPVAAETAPVAHEPASPPHLPVDVRADVPADAPPLAVTPLPATPTLAASPTTTVFAPAAPGPASTPAPAVRAQVFEKVTSLVSRGNGTHRLTLTLQPEQLGEVRVVMTVRDGTVQVRLAAGGHDARAALRDGVPDLHRLLQATGATDTRVVIRELGSTADPGTAAGNGSGNGTGGFAQPDADRSPQQHARTRADQPATDGDSTSPRRSAVPDAAGTRPLDQVTTARASGVDVTI